MPISVNKETCIGCGACTALCPENFKMTEEGKSEPINQEITDCTKNAEQTCPVQAITVE